ncbi:hypothetical protein [Salinifilum ghardaiensis]
MTVQREANVSGDSERVKAFRERMRTLVAESTSNREAAGQRWQETLDQAGRKADEQVEKAQKLVERVRERAAYLRRQEESNEISVGEGIDEEDRDPEVEHFAQSLREQQRAQEQAAAPAAATSAAAESPAPGTASSAGGSAPSGTSGPGAGGTAPQDTWQVQAGRFGRQRTEDSEQSASKQKPASPANRPGQQPAPEPPRKPAPPREPVFDEDDDDFSNQTWLR